MQISRFNRFLSVFFTVVVVIGICAAALMFVHSRYVGLKYVAFPSVETAEELDNPYQGYYNVYGFRLSEKGKPLKDLDTVIEKDGDTKLVLIEINLNYYSDSEISDIGLMQLDTVLSKWSETAYSALCLRLGRQKRRNRTPKHKYRDYAYEPGGSGRQ